METKTTSLKKVVPDTSALIGRILTTQIQSQNFKVDEIIVHKATVAELENQANSGKEIGYIGLDELSKLEELEKQGKIKKLSYSGRRPDLSEIMRAKGGEIDALIRDLAGEEKATLVTCDLVQSRVAKVSKVETIYFEPKISENKLTFTHYFDEKTMSVHIRENESIMAKKGLPGAWTFEKVAEELKVEKIRELIKQIIQYARVEKDAYIESETKTAKVVQIKDYRIVITEPPLSSVYEITIVRPIKRMLLEEYKLNPDLFSRLSSHAEGILIAGPPGHGKSTFANALAAFYVTENKIVKTLEAPRDMSLKGATQYAYNQTTPDNIYQILLLSRPDRVVFDEMRTTKDFLLFADLRLAGMGMIGVAHGSRDIEIIQRLMGRIELGMLPHITDTIIFIQNGQVASVLALKMTVRPPTGMTEEDLARPVVEVRDFYTNKLKYEIYSYGEQTIVVPVEKQPQSKVSQITTQAVEGELRKKLGVALKVEQQGDIFYVYTNERNIPRIVGRGGERIRGLEQELGVRLKVTDQPANQNNNHRSTFADIKETRNAVELYGEKNSTYAIYAGNSLITSLRTDKGGTARIPHHSGVGKVIRNLIRDGVQLELRVI